MSLTKVTYAMISGAPVNVLDYGADPTGIDDSTDAIQAAVDATSYGGNIYFPAGQYKLTDEIRLTQPITVIGNGPGQPFGGVSGAALDGSYIYQSNTTKNAFTLVASLDNYTFSQYAISGINFQDICITGALTNVASKALAGIGVDTSINGGDFHIRGNSMTNCIVKFFQYGVRWTGIAYLNNFFNCIYQYNTVGFQALQGLASDRGGQTRFFGCTFDGNETGINWYTDTATGADLYISGCTIADGKYGISCEAESPLTVIGSHFESLTDSGSGYAIYVNSPTGSNPNSEGPKYIVGNNFNANDKSLVFDTQQASGFTGIYYPVHIDCNVFFDPTAILVYMPSGQYLNSNAFVLGASNVGTNNGQIASTQLSNFYGNDLRKPTITKRFVFGGSYTSGANALLFPPGFYPTSVRVYFTANSSVFTSIGVFDGTTTYISGINGQTQTLNTWVTWTPIVPEVQSSGWFSIQGTAGMSGAQGVLEIAGYIA